MYNAEYQMVMLNMKFIVHTHYIVKAIWAGLDNKLLMFYHLTGLLLRCRRQPICRVASMISCYMAKSSII
jgi:hypothetical protein